LRGRRHRLVILGGVADVVFYGGPEHGRAFRWPTSPPPLRWRVPQPLVRPPLSLDAEVAARPLLVAEYECRREPGGAFVYVYVGTRED
jgi:hypothetical protein